MIQQIYVTRLSISNDNKYLNEFFHSMHSNEKTYLLCSIVRLEVKQNPIGKYTNL